MFPYNHDCREHIIGFGNFGAPPQIHRSYPGTENTAVKTLTDSEIRADQLRSEIAQLEARYDGSFPPGVYSALESLRADLVALSKTG